MSRSVRATGERPGGKRVGPDELRQMGVAVLHDDASPAFVALPPEVGTADLAAYRDATVDLLYCGGILHRLAREDADSFVSECFRILKPLGTLRVATVDLDEIVHSYLFDWKSDSGSSRTRRLNAALRSPGAQFFYSEEELTDLLGHAGFGDIARLPPGASSHERFWDLEVDGTQRLVVEATKP